MAASTFQNSVSDVKRLLPLVLKRAWLPLLALHLGKTLSLQLLSYAGLLLQREGREDIGLLITVVGLNFFFEILWSAVWSFAAISATRSAVRDEPLRADTMASDFNQLLIEGVRTMAAVVLRLPLLLVPAAIEVLRLLFVPHVVLLEPSYRRGQTDALVRSRQLVRLAWMPLLMTAAGYFIAGIVIDSLTQGASGEAWIWQHPVAFLLSALLTLFINLVYEVFLVALFLRLSLKIAAGLGPDGNDPLGAGDTRAHFQLETSS